MREWDLLGPRLELWVGSEFELRMLLNVLVFADVVVMVLFDVDCLRSIKSSSSEEYCNNY